MLLTLIGFNSNAQTESWKLNNYIDKFGDKTSDQYISYSDNNGFFSNSATKKSELKTDITISFQNDYTIKKHVVFYLYEYGSGQAVGKSLDDVDYKLFVKTNEGVEHEFSLNAVKNALLIKEKDNESFISLLNYSDSSNLQDIPLKCFIIISGNYSEETYNFNIKTRDFIEKFTRLNNNWITKILPRGVKKVMEVVNPKP